MPPLNAPGHIECKFMYNAVESMMESDLGGLTTNFQRVSGIKMTLKDISHIQSVTTIVANNLLETESVTYAENVLPRY